MEDFIVRGTYTYVGCLSHITHRPPPTAGVPASIALPAELFNQVPADRPVIGVYFALYINAALFPTNLSAVVRDNVTRSVGTPIVAATVGPGIDFGGDIPLDPPVVITLGLLPLPENTSVRTKYMHR